MKTSTKAALLSAFIFPGAGHFYLKQRAVGNLILVTTIASLSYLCWHAYQRAQLISEQIFSGEIPLQLDAIYSAVTQAPVGNEAIWINLATAGFIVTWIIGIADAYRLGRRQDSD
ncbi:hypothetical protein CXF83_20680 [Shewanella sp. Choline-02u-19]|uniref:DUF6677 family protein n=1 Tax=unclassified Shewanella TaxID=196818 RepID=UPI000C3423A0|nr:MULTISPECIES: DUF6677 family protein [unclassified Shewanella]PKG58437.1 hypothetical protein CXF82_04530 [Shewanella sp. GutDb-MelDb]PKG74871.1 hypothetical protein CXF86_09695 [Shewanella sp. GutCb]PKH53801.1 hypothetical protein CXF84_21235 [Shewanella sp. Bg11-22]PKI28946.1 hypothetical protein CXF83_20680 [Shewanella sp. Choline-02u-19]